MKKQILTKHLLLSFVIVFSLTTFLHGGVYMKQKRHTDAFSMMGQNQPAEDVIEEIWLTENGFRSDSPDNSMIMMFDKGKMVMLDHEKKTYMEMPMDLSSEMPGTEEMDEEDMAAMQGMMQNMGKTKISVQSTGQKKTLNGWKCNKYILTMTTMMGTNSMEIWATEDLKIDPNLYTKFSSSMSASNPMMQNMAGSLNEEMKKIKGVQVLSTSTQNIMNQKVSSSTELLEFKSGKAPSNLFEIPAAYKKTKM
jgi:hypothetical protein